MSLKAEICLQPYRIVSSGIDTYFSHSGAATVHKLGTREIFCQQTHLPLHNNRHERTWKEMQTLTILAGSKQFSGSRTVCHQIIRVPPTTFTHRSEQ